MSYRVCSYHKACLSLVLRGWLVVLLLGRRISSANAISPLISRCALDTSGDISISEVWSINSTSSIYSNSRAEHYLADLDRPRSLSRLISAADRAVCVCATESDVGMETRPLRRWNRLRANQSRLCLNIPHGSANRMKEKAAAAVMLNSSK